MTSCACLQNNSISVKLLQSVQDDTLADDSTYGWNDLRPWSHANVESSSATANARACGIAFSDQPGKPPKPSNVFNRLSGPSTAMKDFVQRNIQSPQQLYRFYHHNAMDAYMEQYRKLHTVVARLTPAQPTVSSSTFQALSQPVQPAAPVAAAPSNSSATQQSSFSSSDPWEKWRVPPLASNIMPFANSNNSNSTTIAKTNGTGLGKVMANNGAFGQHFQAISSAGPGARLPLEVQGEVMSRRAAAALDQDGERNSRLPNNKASIYQEVRDGNSEQFAVLLQERLQQLQVERQKSSISLRSGGPSEEALPDEMEDPPSMYYTEPRPASVGRSSFQQRGDSAGAGALDAFPTSAAGYRVNSLRPGVNSSSMASLTNMRRGAAITSSRRSGGRALIMPNNVANAGKSNGMATSPSPGGNKETLKLWTNPLAEGAPTAHTTSHSGTNLPYFPVRSPFRGRQQYSHNGNSAFYTRDSE